MLLHDMLGRGVKLFGEIPAVVDGDVRLTYNQAEIKRLKKELKRERIRQQIYATREEARSDVFDYIKMF